jgi:hypothetical protein
VGSEFAEIFSGGALLLEAGVEGWPRAADVVGEGLDLDGLSGWAGSESVERRTPGQFRDCGYRISNMARFSGVTSAVQEIPKSGDVLAQAAVGGHIVRAGTALVKRPHE